MQLPAWNERPATRADMQVANVPMRKWDAEIRKIPGQPAFLDPIIAYLNDLRGNLVRGDGLLLWGPYRSGKSSIAASIVREVARHRCRAYWLEAFELADGWEEDDHRADFMRAAHLVVLDDMGTEGDAEFRRDMIRRALRYRLERAGATIVTSNMPPPDLRKHYGEKMATLMQECLKTVPIDGIRWESGDGGGGEIRPGAAEGGS